MTTADTEAPSRSRPAMPARVAPSTDQSSWFWYCGFCVDRDGGYGWAPVSAAYDAARTYVAACLEAQTYLDELRELVG